MSGFILRDAPEKLETLLPAPADTAGQRAAMRFIYNNELGTLDDEIIRSSLALDEVGGNNSESVAIKYRHAHWEIALQFLDCATQD
jgi:hypothetical protein